MSATLTPSEKRTITWRANKQKREQIAAAREERAERAAEPADTEYTARILPALADIAAARTELGASAALDAALRRQELRRQRVVSLAEWRAFAWPAPTHVRGKPVPPPAGQRASSRRLPRPRPHAHLRGAERWATGLMIQN